MPLAIPTPPSPLYLLPCRRFVRAAQARWDASPLPPNRRPPVSGPLRHATAACANLTADDWTCEQWVGRMHTIHTALTTLAQWELAQEVNQRGGLASTPPPPTAQTA